MPQGSVSLAVSGLLAVFESAEVEPELQGSHSKIPVKGTQVSSGLVLLFSGVSCLLLLRLGIFLGLFGRGPKMRQLLLKAAKEHRHAERLVSWECQRYVCRA